jgi:ComF family protein
MDLIKSILNTIFPHRCAVCDDIIDPESLICSGCMSRINWLRADFFSTELKETKFFRAASLAAYDGFWAEAIHRFKYNNRTDLAAPFAKIMAERIDYEYDFIMPVPLHHKRLRERGYNQSALLAKKVAAEAGIKFAWDAIKRTATSMPQVGLTRGDRLRNVKGIFKCGKDDGLAKSDILLIDDVITTGATVNECAKALKNAGAARIDVLTLARTI